ncbi:guanosine-diphosphatase-like protein [Emericellopsis cladophorae]|uniref:guanosine-diphosphatase n=1 Tax=Emericellopsis cladophorae TaxID=2686198 RepID=A0A9Q0BHS8_9HYPO|nr:guanosine-diphosphatase-like protein [Emericellopsis cladophorae]KAI6785075.1 guanosine-diphosphatase-like protein [Emericellopsis cladophorae]
MRRSSVSLPTSKQVAHDPYEKPDRYYNSAREGGYFAKMKESWLAQSQKSKWLKIGGVAFAVICLLYFFTPSGYEVYNGVGGNSGQSPADDSYGTPKCTKSYSKDKSIVEYVLMIDAGSTGSRIHVYKFNNCGPTPELEGEEFMMTEKSVGGLSKYKDDPVAAAKTLDPLLQRAMDTVPEKLKGCSPIAVKATAGLRMIGEEAADAILKQVRTHLEQDYPFPVVSQEHDGVAIMPGSQEGVYAWITTNYLLKKIGGPDKGETAAVFDLGGGSTQIVFEPTFKGAADGGMPGELAEGDQKYTLDFGGRHFDLYQHSHLNFGLMAARTTIHETLVKDIALDKGTDDAWMSKPITHPCFAVGMSKEIEVSYENKDHSFNFTGPSEPAPAQCRALAEKILNKGAACNIAPCSFNGIYQPPLAKTFANEDVYIFSYFYDRTKPIGMPDSFTLREMHDLANTVCKGAESWDVFGSIPGAMDELKDRPEHCLDLNFMMALLHTGYEMPIDREVKIAKKIDGNELGWCLGASLPLLESNSGWECKLKKVQ